MSDQLSSLLDEELVPVARAAHFVPGGTSPATVWRWIDSGVAGVKLEALRVGRRLMTSRAAVHRFLAASSDALAERREARRATLPSPERQSDRAATRERRVSRARAEFLGATDH